MICVALPPYAAEIGEESRAVSNLVSPNEKSPKRGLMSCYSVAAKW
ncbi:hypothetical protein BQ8794_10151 [Mesorhizobium prunaredense]|uniref:Uncharacterized protein n=1 Tax=Mesorhizobium prunaredense TaxID=1631249 RepID=A0A1R3UYR4_9HYPH|nr:hypothetical protein BQ8794_10151 [Mesorhizobium prunaredense]